ncbi:Ger(x)C family spore germination protein [Halobacillus locisalis]|uniref:Ger(X)C family spore germination protein n=1 Tax=Halobacillus locisalis TaxID=220753 RepID=A0A838CP13_9BACI|nr:Ger(x)C family spore germination protein [Halobacillus locisalis]MBA2173694.1 Ger(x)C family spore germination protein [Halobacillus locisalis]
MRNKVMIAVLILFLLTGCWDSREIEDIGIIMGIGLEKSEEGNVEMVNQYVVPSQIPSAHGGDSNKIPFQNISLSGDTLFQIIRNNSFESNRPPNYTHLKTILFSSSLLKSERADELIDLFMRDHEFRRTTPVFITEESVNDVFSTQPTKELFPAIQIKALSENAGRNFFIPENLSIGDMSKYISENKSFLLPGLKLEEGKILSDGAGIISSDTFQFLGWVDKSKMGGVRFILNDIKGGYINFSKEEISDGPLVLELKGSNTTYEVNVEDGKVIMHLRIEATTSLGEDWGNYRTHFREGWKEEIEEASNSRIEKSILEVIKLAQEEYKTDFLNLSNWIRIYQPDFWSQNKKNWNQVFAEMEVTVEAKTTITDFGTQNLK